MRQRTFMAPTLREASSEAEAASHQLLLRAGYIRQLAAGVYTYLPLGLRVLRKLEGIIREEMERAGAQELLMPAMQPAELWQASGRYDVYGPELIRLHDRHGREFALGPTHEEVITTVVKNEINTYRKLPFALFQIQTKFRDERRPRFGLLRGREFLMKDAYSFDADWDGLDRAYRAMYGAYERIFSRAGLNFRAVEADSGAIGGDGETHEFMALADIGEDTIVSCTHCQYAANLEIAEQALARGGNGTLEGAPCPRCAEGLLRYSKGIELGHVFKLGTKYSKALQAVFLDPSGVEQPIVMGCYGIGVSRMLSAAAEQRHDDAGLLWPLAIAPFHVHLIPISMQDEAMAASAEALYQRLTAAGIQVLLDDREERPGVKFKDADLIGIPVRIVVGKSAGEGKVEYKERSGCVNEAIGIEEAHARVLALAEQARSSK
jgi:prolyl-tRNA synthetase